MINIFYWDGVYSYEIDFAIALPILPAGGCHG
jgi:hypothetical protein